MCFIKNIFSVALLLIALSSSAQVKEMDGFSILFNSHEDSRYNESILRINDTSNYALLYIYRPKKFRGKFDGYNLYIDDANATQQFVGKMKNNTLIIVKIKELGQIKVWGKAEIVDGVTINAKRGRIYYVKCAVKFGVVAARPNIAIVSKEEAISDNE